MPGWCGSEAVACGPPPDGIPIHAGNTCDTSVSTMKRRASVADRRACARAARGGVARAELRAPRRDLLEHGHVAPRRRTRRRRPVGHRAPRRAGPAQHRRASARDASPPPQTSRRTSLTPCLRTQAATASMSSSVATAMQPAVQSCATSDRQLGESRPAARRTVDADRAARESHARLRRRRVLRRDEDVEVLRRARRPQPVAAERRPVVALALLADAAHPERDGERTLDLAVAAQVHLVGARVDDDARLVRAAIARRRGRGRRTTTRTARTRNRGERGQERDERGHGAARSATAVPAGQVHRKPASFDGFFGSRRARAAPGRRQTVNSFDGGGRMRARR